MKAFKSGTGAVLNGSETLRTEAPGSSIKLAVGEKETYKINPNCAYTIQNQDEGSDVPSFISKSSIDNAFTINPDKEEYLNT